EVSEPGRYYLWNNYRMVFEGESYNRSEELPDAYQISFRDGEGRELDLVGDLSITFNGTSGSRRSIGYVEIGGPTRVEIEVVGSGDRRVFAFGRSYFWGAFRSVGLAMVLGFVLGSLGLGLMIWGFIRLAQRNGRSGETERPPGGEPPPIRGKER
ncbi:MAG: hypothetical protein AAGD22_18480, partial [Verrucomicrobiota bacterium]